MRTSTTRSPCENACTSAGHSSCLQAQAQPRLPKEHACKGSGHCPRCFHHQVRHPIPMRTRACPHRRASTTSKTHDINKCPTSVMEHTPPSVDTRCNKGRSSGAIGSGVVKRTEMQPQAQRMRLQQRRRSRCGRSSSHPHGLGQAHLCRHGKLCPGSVTPWWAHSPNRARKSSKSAMSCMLFGIATPCSPR